MDAAKRAWLPFPRWVSSAEAPPRRFPRSFASWMMATNRCAPEQIGPWVVSTRYSFLGCGVLHRNRSRNESESRMAITRKQALRIGVYVTLGVIVSLVLW